MKDRTTEPSHEVAWKYVSAYFERAREAAFELVDRASFESRLRSHLKGDVKNEDPAWYALRNAIYATGCRIELSKTGNFRYAFQTAWTFFSNCLSVHLELLYFRTSMMAIQALTIMGYFTESIGNPCLEYMLSTVALRLACSKGLHRQAVSSWHMSQEEKELRNRIFWAAYCLEKNCAARSGRPSRLTFIETQQQSAELLVKTVAELDQKLKALERFIQQLVDLDSPLESCRPGADIDLQQAVYLRMAYYITVLDVHTPLTYPWSQRLFHLAGNPDLRDQVQASSEIVIKTARKVILATQFVRLDATTSILMGFHGPLYALINMFIYILEDTKRSTVQSDLALFDIGASHFLRLEFSTDSEVSFHFAKELALLSRRAIDHSNMSLEASVDCSGVLSNPPGNLLDSGGRGVPGFNDFSDPLRDGFSSSFLDFDFEHCSTFLPTPDLDDCDIIQLGSNATRVMSNWGNVLEEETKVSGNPSCMNILEKSGKVLLQAPMPTEFDGYPVLFSNRGCLQRLIFEHANSLGIKFRFGTKVESYFEEDDCAGVIINGERLQGDAVIAADGVHSIARKSVMGIHQHPRSSGFAVYRTCFSLDLLGNDPLTKPLTEVKEDTFQVWLGPDVHAILFITVAVRQAVIFCTHKDTYEVEESWSNPGDIKDLLHVVDGWDPVIVAAMKAIPHDKLIDWKLLWRDPIRQWVSPKGRIVLAGDSAHPHLPTSGQGAAQAFEDGATIGVVLDRLGREDIPTAFRAFERLRFERTSLTQRMGWETRHRWHQTDWEAVAADPSFLKMPQPLWLYSFDAEGYADNRLSEVVQSVKGGSPFKSTNLPEGHVHEDWTVESMMALEKEQAKEHFYRVANR
ncbi:hypothetical protein ACJ41O_009090 [Fusarium nematophilum]